MLLFDAHLDLSLNALSWNRDLTQPLSDVREREYGKTDINARGTGTVSLPEMRAADIDICIAMQIGHSVSKHPHCTAGIAVNWPGLKRKAN